MTTQFTEENYQILYDEQKNVVEIRFQGVNALQLFSLQTQLDALNTSFQNSLATVTGDMGTLETTVSGLTSLANAINSGLSAEESARLAADVALGNDISLNVSNLQAAIDAEVAARAAALLAEAEARNVAIVDATSTLVTDQAAMAVTIQGLATSMGAAEANIVNVQDAISTETAARAAQFSALQADFGDTNAAILEESVVRSNSVDALASQIETLAVSSGTTVFIQPDAPTTGMVTGDAWYDSDDGNKAYRYDGTQWVDVTDVRIINNAAAILAEQTARANGDSANATSITNLTATVNVKTQTFAQPNQPTANAIGDIWIDTDSLPANLPYRWNGTNWILIENADIAANKAAIQTEAQARADADSAEALARTTLAARVTTNEGDISDNAAAIVLEQQARADAISAEAGQRAILAARVDDAEAAILLEQTARSDGDSANASLIGTLTTDLGDLTTTVSNETSARIAADGAINAKYGVKVNANGHVAGFGLIVNGNTYNGTVDSEFVIDATRFKVYNGASAVVPFQVSGGVVYMTNVKIGDAQIDTLSVNKLTAGTLGVNVTQNGNWTVGTGKIIFDNGVYLKASGVGFGSSNQFIEWFGPRPSGGNLALCTEANAIQYLKTNGSAYFGGTLSAGILRNSVTGTLTASNAETILGPFGTNGGSKTVAYSYYFTHNVSLEGTASFTDPPTATLVFERRISGGAWTTLGTHNITGSTTYFPGYGWAEPGFYQAVLSGSWTTTDTNTSTGNFEYRLRLTARNVTLFIGGTTEQTQTIISTEE